MKNTLKYLFKMVMAVVGTSAYAASGVIELEIPGMNEETAAVADSDIPRRHRSAKARWFSKCNVNVSTEAKSEVSAFSYNFPRSVNFCHSLRCQIDHFLW